jgi:hypothetical protein
MSNSVSCIVNSDLKKLISEMLDSKEWEIVSKNKHMKIRNVKSGIMVSIPITPSDRRICKNIITKLKYAANGYIYVRGGELRTIAA